MTDNQLAALLHGTYEPLVEEVVRLNKLLIKTDLPKCKDGDHALELIPLVDITVRLRDQICILRGEPTHDDAPIFGMGFSMRDVSDDHDHGHNNENDSPFAGGLSFAEILRDAVRKMQADAEKADRK